MCFKMFAIVSYIFKLVEDECQRKEIGALMIFSNVSKILKNGQKHDSHEISYEKHGFRAFSLGLLEEKKTHVLEQN